MSKQAATTISDGNAQFVRTCLDGLVAFHARWGIGRVQPNVAIRMTVNASILFHDEGKDAEMSVGFFHDDIAFLLIGSGERFPETLCFGHPRNREGEGCLFAKRCRPEELPEIIRSSLELHLDGTIIASLQRETSRHAALLQKLQRASTETGE